MARSDCHEFEQPLLDCIARLKQALEDIASSQPIPTPVEGWEFCRDMARDTLSELSAKDPPCPQDTITPEK